jgi:hypothetical protein
MTKIGKEVEDLLNQAVKESIDSLTLFTLPLLQDQKDFAIVFNQELLQRINKNFNFHGLFNISIPSVEDGSAVMMKFFVIGQGKFIAGYDRNAKIKQKIIDPIPIEKLYNESEMKDTGEDKARKHPMANCSGIQTCGQYFALQRQPFLSGKTARLQRLLSVNIPMGKKGDIRNIGCSPFSDPIDPKILFVQISRFIRLDSPPFPRPATHRPYF